MAEKETSNKASSVDQDSSNSSKEVPEEELVVDEHDGDEMPALDTEKKMMETSKASNVDRNSSSNSKEVPEEEVTNEDETDEMPTLHIHRVYRNQDGTEFNDTEEVTDPSLIQNYLKMRTLLSRTQLRDFAFDTDEALTHFKLFRRKLNKRFAYHAKRQQNMQCNSRRRLKARNYRRIFFGRRNRRNNNTRKIDANIIEGCIKEEDEVDDNALLPPKELDETEAVPPPLSCPSTVSPSPTPSASLPASEPPPTHTVKTCTACGQQGHTRRSKACPEYFGTKTAALYAFTKTLKANGTNKAKPANYRQHKAASQQPTMKNIYKPSFAAVMGHQQIAYDIPSSSKSVLVADAANVAASTSSAAYNHSPAGSSGYSTTSSSAASADAAAPIVGTFSLRSTTRRANAGIKRGRYSPGLEGKQQNDRKRRRMAPRWM